MQTLAIIICIVLAIILFVRYWYFKVLRDTYYNFVTYYVLLKKVEMEDVPDYILMSPMFYIVLEFWNWNFRHFMLNKELFDDVITFAREEVAKNQK